MLLPWLLLWPRNAATKSRVESCSIFNPKVRETSGEKGETRLLLKRLSTSIASRRLPNPQPLLPLAPLRGPLNAQRVTASVLIMLFCNDELLTCKHVCSKRASHGALCTDGRRPCRSKRNGWPHHVAGTGMTTACPSCSRTGLGTDQTEETDLVTKKIVPQKHSWKTMETQEWPHTLARRCA